MTLKEYIAQTIKTYYDLGLPTPTTITFDIAVMPNGGYKDGKLEYEVIVDGSPTQYSSRIKFDVQIN